MVSRPTRILLAISLGTLLLVNPAFGLPGEATKTYTYTAEPVESVFDVDFYLDRSDLLLCNGQLSRHCLLERRARDGGVRLDASGDPNASRVSTAYEFVGIEGSYYRPAVNVENGSYVLTLEPVSERTVLDGLARHDEDGLPALASRAVREGEVNVTRPLDEERLYEDGMLVEHEGTYYLVRVVESDIHHPITEAWWFRILRGLGVLLGGVLVLYGYNLPTDSNGA